MEEGKALINIGELSKPATVLIEKISEAVGGVFRPYQIRRVAEAEANAEKIRTVSKIEVTDLERRAMRRFLEEEGKKQENIESITNKALPNVAENSKPEKIENDWLANFFDKCRLISDEEMQNLWAKVLAGEANNPGKFSRKTVSVLSSIDKSDAILLQKLCSFCVEADFLSNQKLLLIYDEPGGPQMEEGINFGWLKHLEDIGLIVHERDGFFLSPPKKFSASYYDFMFKVEVMNSNQNRFPIGNAMLSKAGHNLAFLCESTPKLGFTDFIVKKWKSFGLKITTP